MTRLLCEVSFILLCMVFFVLYYAYGVQSLKHTMGHHVATNATSCHMVDHSVNSSLHNFTVYYTS